MDASVRAAVPVCGGGEWPKELIASCLEPINAQEGRRGPQVAGPTDLA